MDQSGRRKVHVPARGWVVVGDFSPFFSPLSALYLRLTFPSFFLFSWLLHEPLVPFCLNCLSIQQAFV